MCDGVSSPRRQSCGIEIDFSFVVLLEVCERIMVVRKNRGTLCYLMWVHYSYITYVYILASDGDYMFVSDSIWVWHLERDDLLFR